MTQVSFTADEVLKERALEKAKFEGITLKALLTYAMKSYVDGQLKFYLLSPQQEPEDEEVFFDDVELLKKSKKLAQLLA